MNRPLGYGLIGAGAFGRFCIEQYRKLDAVKCIAVADADPKSARRAADDLGLSFAESVEELLARPDIDLVHIATPPSTHAGLAVRALHAGKHVLSEKPLALNLVDAARMMDVARERELSLSVNLIMRYNPLALSVYNIIREGLLGEPLHGFFENYAKDERMGPDHWFWNQDVSGGIFVEHAVHFFDLFRWWLSPSGADGVVEAAQQVHRPGSDPIIIEQVQATVRYGDSTLVNFYHGFTQADRMDRQEMRLLFERGTITLFEWVPTQIEIETICDEATLVAIQRLLPDTTVRCIERYDERDRTIESRHKRYSVDGRFVLSASAGMDKEALYGYVLRSLLADQVRSIREPGFQSRITAQNGYDSLAAAIQARTLAMAGTPNTD